MGSWVGIRVMVREWFKIFCASIFGFVLEMSLGTQLPYEVEDKTDGFHFIGTVHVTRRLAQNTYQAFIRKEQTGVLHSEREGTERAGGISRRLHGICHLNDRRAELCLFRDRKGRPIRIKDDCLVATSPLG